MDAVLHYLELGLVFVEVLLVLSLSLLGSLLLVVFHLSFLDYSVNEALNLQQLLLEFLDLFVQVEVLLQRYKDLGGRYVGSAATLRNVSFRFEYSNR